MCYRLSFYSKLLARASLVAALFFISVVSAHAQGSSATGMSYLKLGVGARAIAMGDIGVVLIDDGTSLHFNPASFLREEGASISLMSNSWIQDVNTEYFGITRSLDDWGFGLSLYHLSVKGIEIRTRPGPPEGTFDSQDFAAGLSVAHRLWQGFTLGVTGKFYYQNIYQDDAVGYGADVGVSYTPDIAGFSAGLALLNLGSMNPLVVYPTELPGLARVGVGYVGALTDADVDFALSTGITKLLDGDEVHLQVGGEITYIGLISVRGGYQTGYGENRIGISAGLGITYSDLHFDYAFTPFQREFGFAHAVSLAIDL